MTQTNQKNSLTRQFLEALLSTESSPYITLLDEDAILRFGYQIATIQAQPMSKPIVGRYGFKVYATSYIFGWMPVMDMDIINSLVQDR